MTSVESHRFSEHHLTDDVEADVDRTNVTHSSNSPRYEAFVMTGNHILPAGRVSRTNIRQVFKSPPSQVPPISSPTNNIVLRSPVLCGAQRNYPSHSSQEEENCLPPTPPEPLDGGLASESQKEDDRIIFQYRTHDVHGFRLTTSDARLFAGENNGKDESGDLTAYTIDRGTGQGDCLFGPVSDSQKRPFTPEIVDDRPVWTVNAPPTDGVFSKSLPGSPSTRRRLGLGQQRFKEILKEETVITDTTISELTDTNTSTSYILNSPRTPRHLDKNYTISPILTHTHTERSISSEKLKAVTDAVEGVLLTAQPDQSAGGLQSVEKGSGGTPEVMANQLSGVAPSSDLEDGQRDAFVHPESARACMDIFPLEEKHLDDALRIFLRDVRLVGETEARQRVIDLFAMRYIECNPKSPFTRDAANCAVSAMLILNSDLYSQHRPKYPMDLNRFVDSLRQIPACVGLSDEELRRLFQSVKNEPLPVAGGVDGQFVAPLSSVVGPGVSRKSGYLSRKSCIDAGGKSTRWGNRGWHRFFVILDDMSLEFYRKEPANDGASQSATAPTPLHHGYVAAAVDYRKYPWVLRFRAIDNSVILLRAVNRDDFEEWLRCINETAALNSVPVSLPVGSQTMGQESRHPSLRLPVRPLYSSAKSSVSPPEQVSELQQTEKRLQREIRTINTEEPKTRKDVLFMSSQLDFFKQELERTQAYLMALTSMSTEKSTAAQAAPMRDS